MPDTTAITIVSISAGAAVAVGGGVLNAQLFRRQAERQFAHERQMADVAELRLFLEGAMAEVEHVIECILGLSSDLDDAARSWPGLSLRLQSRRSAIGRRRSKQREALPERISAQLADQVQGIAELAEPLRQVLTGLMMRIGRQHPLTDSFRGLLSSIFDTIDALPSSFPPSDQERSALEHSWEKIGDIHGGFLDLVSVYVGVDRELRKGKLAAPRT